MFKSVKKLICLFSVVCICLFAALIHGCNGEPEPEPYTPPKNCDVVLETTAGWGETYENFIAICDSYEEMLDELSRHGCDSFESETVREYMEEHSEDKSLVVFLYVRTGDNGPLHIKEIEVNEDGRLTMYIKFPDSNIYDTVVGSAFLIAGVDKSFVKDVTSLTYVLV